MKIVWTETAELTYKAELDFILKKWNVKERNKFILLIDEVTQRLVEFPTIGRYSDTGDIYLVISKQTTLIYRLLDDDILELLLFWNNKQNPDDLEQIINSLRK